MEPFLSNGFNLAIWQSIRKAEYFMERLHILEMDFATISPPSFKNSPERLSILLAFLILRFLKGTNLSTTL